MSKDLGLPAVFPQGDTSYIDALNLNKNKVKHFLYQNDQSEVVFGVKVDYNFEKKKITPFSYCDGQWVKKLAWKDIKGWKRPLFNLPKILNSNQDIIVLEGEKKTVNAIKLFQDKFICTTFQGGKSNWQHTDWSPLAGKKITLWPDIDQDGGGLKFFKDLTIFLNKEHDCDARIVKLPHFDDLKKQIKEETGLDYPKKSYDLGDELIPSWKENLFSMIEDTYIPQEQDSKVSEYSDIQKDRDRYIYIAEGKGAYYDKKDRRLVTAKILNDLYLRDPSINSIHGATKWLHNNHCPQVNGIAFKPGFPQIFKGKGKFENQNLLNKYQAPSFEKIKIDSDYDISIFRDHLKNILCSGNEIEFNRLENILASDFRYPERNRKFMVVFKSEQGVGKSWLWGVLSECYGPRNCQHIDFQALTGTFQGFLADSNCLFIDEVESRGFEDKDRRANLKRLVSESLHTIQDKQISHFTVDCHYTLWGSTNETIPLKIENDDRRLYYLEIQDQKKDILEKYGSDYFEKLFNFFDPDIRNTKMMQNIHHVYDYYRHRFPIDESFNIFNAPETEARKRLVEMSRPQYYRYLDDLINSKELNCLKKDLVNIGILLRELLQEKSDDPLNPLLKQSWTENKIYSYFQKHPDYFVLPHPTMGVDSSDHVVRGRVWCIRNYDFWKINQVDSVNIKSHLIDGQLDTSAITCFEEKRKKNNMMNNIN